MIVKEQQVKDMLFKEASSNREHQKSVVVNEFLFKDAQERLGPQILADPKPMGRQKGSSNNLKNSGANIDWALLDVDKKINKLQQDVYISALKYFKSLGQMAPTDPTGMSGPQGMSGDFRPNKPLAFVFKYIRRLEANNHPESKAKSDNAFEVLNDYFLDGESGLSLKSFKEALNSSSMPTLPYYMPLPSGADSGYIEVGNRDILNNFVQSESRNPLTLPEGSMINSERRLDNSSHYQNHLSLLQQGRKLKISSARQKKRNVSVNDLSGLDLYLDDIIDDHISQGYYLNHNRFKSIMVNNGVDEGKINSNLYTIEEYIKAQKVDELAIQIQRAILQSMSDSSGNNLEQFIWTVRTVHSNNGWDDDEQGVKMPVFPPVIQLPKTNNQDTAEVRYDRANGNMGYNQLTDNWNELGPLITTYGKVATEWFHMLNGPVPEDLQQTSPEAYAAWSTISTERTGAENLLDTFDKFGDTWEIFNQEHLSRSMYSELHAVDEAQKRNSGPTRFVPGVEASDQIAQFNLEISRIAQQDPQAAREMIMDLSADVVNNYYMTGAIDWDDTTDHLYNLNESGRNIPEMKKGNGLGSGDKPDGMKTPEDFDLLKQYGYQIAKMMDFVNAIIGRSSHKQISTNPNGQPENFYHFELSGSSGKTKGGNISLKTNFDQIDAQVMNNEIQVTEKLSFTFSQKTGEYHENPFSESSPSSWEQTLSQVLNTAPDIGILLEGMSNEVDKKLQMVENKVKAAIRGAIQKSGISMQVTYVNNDGIRDELNPQQVEPQQVEPQQNDQTPATSTDIPPVGTGTDADLPVDSTVAPTGLTGDPQLNSTNTEIPGNKTLAKPMDSSMKYLKKRKNPKRKLFKERSTALGSIEERLVKAANKLDSSGEITVADKIDILLQKLREVK